MITSLRTALEEFALLLVPHGGQRTARRNAWRAAYDGRQAVARQADPTETLVALAAVTQEHGRVAAAASP